MSKKEIYHMSWGEVLDRALRVLPGGKSVYGIPRGGAVAAGIAFLSHQGDMGLATTPLSADLFLDDIIDSGRTMERFTAHYPGVPFVALVDKLGADKNMGWIHFPWEEPADKDIEGAVIRQMEYIGEDPNREGLQKTPGRVVRSWGKIYGGYGQSPEDLVRGAIFTDEGYYDQIVLLRDIELYSTCEHHILPFHGKAHIAYIPDGKVIGISKLARILECFSRRLQIQERICHQVTETLEALLEPKAAACIIEAQHFCMTSRGVEKQKSIMVTSSLKGAFIEKPSSREELLRLIHSG